MIKFHRLLQEVFVSDDARADVEKILNDKRCSIAIEQFRKGDFLIRESKNIKGGSSGVVFQKKGYDTQRKPRDVELTIDLNVENFREEFYDSAPSRRRATFAYPYKNKGAKYLGNGYGLPYIIIYPNNVNIMQNKKLSDLYDSGGWYRELQKNLNIATDYSKTWDEKNSARRKFDNALDDYFKQSNYGIRNVDFSKEHETIAESSFCHLISLHLYDEMEK